jgi:hypothetical protein
MRLKRGRKIGPAGSLLLLPFLLMAGVLSFPYAMLTASNRKRNKRKLEVRMEAQGRVIARSEFLDALNETRGTAIIERYSFKGPVYLWWTPENVYDVCPYPTVDWMTLHDESFGPFAEWCRIRYTSRDAGSAVLVVGDTSAAEAYSLHSRFESRTGLERWIEVVPPEAVRKTR